MNATDISLAYLAGIIDADGCITIGADKSPIKVGKSPQFFHLIAIWQCDPEAVKLTQELFGGKIITRKAANKRSRKSYGWVAYGERAMEILRAVYPFLRIKKRQADILFEFHKLKTRPRMENTYLEDKISYRKGRYGSTARYRRRIMKPEVLNEYAELTRRIRSFNDTRTPDPFPDGFPV